MRAIYRLRGAGGGEENKSTAQSERKGSAVASRAEAAASHTEADLRPVSSRRPLLLSLTTVGRANGLALACGRGEPAIAMATD